MLNERQQRPASHLQNLTTIAPLFVACGKYCKYRKERDAHKSGIENNQEPQEAKQSAIKVEEEEANKFVTVASYQRARQCKS